MKRIMRIISQYRNNRLFEVVRVFYNNGELIPGAQYCDQECLQVHTACGHAFHCRWRFQRSIRGLSDEGSAYTCPKCGKRLWKGTYDTPWLDLSESGRKRVLVPYRIELEAKEYKNYLDICAETLNADIESPIDVSVHTVKKYTLRFDFKSREAVYLEHGARGRAVLTQTLWPLNRIASDKTKFCMKDTVFHYLNAESNIHHTERNLINSFFKDVVRCFNQKLSDAAGYTVKSAYMPTSLQDGHSVFDYCFSNLAWRLHYPDARNLTTEEIRMCPYADDPVMRLFDERKPYLQTAREIYRFPDMPGLNARLVKCPINFLNVIRTAWPILHETDNKYKLLDALLQKRYDIGFYHSLDSYLRSLRIVKHTRGEAAAVRLMERENDYIVRDCGHMWDLLTPQNKRIFINAKIRSRDIHDYLVHLVDRQQHANVRIKYKSLRDFPLTGKVDDLIFSLPPDTEQLANLGRAMHNCVGTYRDRVLSDKVRIIAAFKNRKPVVCIEIRGTKVAQAKLVNNQPVREDAELNRALISWAKSRKLTIETNDVQTEREVAGIAAAV